MYQVPKWMSFSHKFSRLLRTGSFHVISSVGWEWGSSLLVASQIHSFYIQNTMSCCSGWRVILVSDWLFEASHEWAWQKMLSSVASIPQLLMTYGVGGKGWTKANRCFARLEHSRYSTGFPCANPSRLWRQWRMLAGIKASSALASIGHPSAGKNYRGLESSDPRWFTWKPFQSQIERWCVCTDGNSHPRLITTTRL